jgi:hypothetical protein
MSVVTPTTPSSGNTSIFWTTPLSESPNDFYSLRDFRGYTLHDSINDGFGKQCISTPDSPSSDDSSALRRYHVFGTPMSQAGTVDKPASPDSEVEIAYGDLGMDMVRDARGSGSGTRASEATSGTVRSKRSLFWNEEKIDFPVARGGHDMAAWVLLDQPGTIVPEILAGVSAGRRPSEITTSDGTTSQKSDTHSPPREGPMVSPPVLRVSTTPPVNIRRGSVHSVESKFKEDLPRPRKGSSPIVWIRNRVRSRTEGDMDGVAERKRKGKGIPRSLKKKLSSFRVLQEATEPSSRSRVNLVEQSTSRSMDMAPTLPSPVDPETETFLAQVDDALNAVRPQSRMRKLSTAMLGGSLRLRTVPSPIRRVAIASSYNDLPPRSKSAPPLQHKRNSIWNLEYLPSEAQGIKTPEELPVFNQKHIGGKRMPLIQEKRYFHLADMVQSQPPLASAGDFSVTLDPRDTPAPVTARSSELELYSDEDCQAIAPFLAQDMMVRSASPSFFRSKGTVSSAGRRFRRASVQALNLIMPRKLSDVHETSPTSRRGSVAGKGKATNVGNPVYNDSVPEYGRPGRGVMNWLGFKSGPESNNTSTEFPGRILRRGQTGSELEIARPVEVVIERARREKRDTGIMGLDPEEAHSASTDDSFTYTSALQDIAGLSKYPKGKNSRAQDQDREIDNLNTPPPPNFPRGSVAPGTLL